MTQPLDDPATQADLVRVAHLCADAAAAETLQHFRSAGLVDDNKLQGDYDPVTIADKNAERAIRAVLRAERPNDTIIGEEQGPEPGDSGLTWVLDPIDGTRGFVSGTPTWGTLIAVGDVSGPAFGIIDQPYIGERFSGGFGKASFAGPQGNGPLQTRAARDLEQAVVFTTFPEVGTAAEAIAFHAVARQAKLARRRKLGGTHLATSVFHHQPVNPKLAEKRFLVLDTERGAADQIFSVREGKGPFWRVNLATDQEAFLQVCEAVERLPPRRQEDATSRFDVIQCLLFLSDAHPMVAIAGGPCRAQELPVWDAHTSGHTRGTMGHTRRERVRGVEDMGDPLIKQKGAECVFAAEAAKTRLDLGELRRTCDTGKRRDCLDLLLLEPCRKAARLPRS